MRIDFHAHAFPDALAPRAIAALEAELLEEGAQARFDGKLGTLIEQLRQHHLDAAVVCSIATKPSQFDPILKWSQAIRDGAFGAEPARRIIPLLSVHPADPDWRKHIEQTAAAGFKGLKIHPYYQNFILDSPEMLDYLRCARDQGLLVVSHTGFDIAFPRERICDPARVARVASELPDLDFVATHLGGWEDWDEVERHLTGRPITMEISYAFGRLPDSRIRDLLLRHPAERLLLGSDWPWNSHAEVLPRLMQLALPPERLDALLGGNAARLLQLQSF